MAVNDGSYTVAGAELQLAVTCPAAAEVAIPFTAAGGELWIFDPSEPNVQIYTLQ